MTQRNINNRRRQRRDALTLIAVGVVMGALAASIAIVTLTLIGA